MVTTRNVYFHEPVRHISHLRLDLAGNGTYYIQVKFLLLVCAYVIDARILASGSVECCWTGKSQVSGRIWSTVREINEPQHEVCPGISPIKNMQDARQFSDMVERACKLLKHLLSKLPQWVAECGTQLEELWAREKSSEILCCKCIWLRCYIL